MAQMFTDDASRMKTPRVRVWLPVFEARRVFHQSTITRGDLGDYGSDPVEPCFLLLIPAVTTRRVG